LEEDEEKAVSSAAVIDCARARRVDPILSPEYSFILKDSVNFANSTKETAHVRFGWHRVAFPKRGTSGNGNIDRRSDGSDRCGTVVGSGKCI
jgi:hypothetical protein